MFNHVEQTLSHQKFKVFLAKINSVYSFDKLNEHEDSLDDFCEPQKEQEYMKLIARNRDLIT